MKYLLLALAFAGSAYGTIAQSAAPIFTDCNCEAESPCNENQLQSLKEAISTTITADIPYYFNDSIYLEFVLDEKGELTFTSFFHLYSNYVLTETQKILSGMSERFCQSNQPYSLAFIYELPEELTHYPEVESVRNPLPVSGTEEFNLTGQRAATRYLAHNMSREIKEKRTPEGNHSGKIYLHKGNLVGLELTSYDEETYFTDSIAYYFYRANQDLVNSKEAGTSDDLWISFNLTPIRDSTERFEYGLRNLDYMIQLRDKEPFLSGLLEFGSRYYSEKEKAHFLYGYLLKAGYTDTDQFSVNGSVYRVDSIANYSPSDSEDDEVLNFAIVEKVPVYQGCEEYDKNEDLKLCFQKSIMSHVGKTFKYPPVARQKGIQGRIYINFVIEKDGSIGMMEVLRGSHPLLDLEAIRVVSEIPDPQPATQRGKPVRMSFTLPINARLQ